MAKLSITTFLRKQFEPLSLLKKGAKILCALCLTLVLLTGFALFTQPGAYLVLVWLAYLTPYDIEFASLEGSLAEQFELKDFKLSSSKFILEAEQLHIRWQWRELFEDKKVQHIYASKMQLSLIDLPQQGIDSLKSDPINAVQTNIDVAMPNFGFGPISVQTLRIDEGLIHWQDTSHQIVELEIKHASTRLSQIQKIRYHGALGTISADLENSIEISWDLNLPYLPQLSEIAIEDLQTKGHLSLPHRQLDDPENKIQFTLHGKQIQFAKHYVENVSMKLNGTLPSHEIILEGSFDDYPLSASLTGKITPQHWQGKISQLLVKHKRWEKMHPITAVMNVHLHQDKIDTNLNLVLENQMIQLHTNVSKKNPYALDGKIHTVIHDLKALTPLVNDFKDVQGKLEVDLNIAGKLATPSLNGNITLKDAKVRTQSIKNQAHLNRLTLNISNDRKLSVNGDGVWGAGPFHIEGQGALDSLSPWITLHFSGTQLLLSDTPEYYIVANPDLKLTIQNGRPTLAGKIYIPHAEIQSLKSPDMVSPSQDVVIVSATKSKDKPLQKRSITTHLTTDIEIVLGEKITYKGLGFKSNIAGKLSLSQQPGQLPAAKGKLILQNGKYRAYGKTFDISYGQILFLGGPIYDPIIDVRAQRTIAPNNMLASFKTSQTIIAGIKFSGHFKSPKIEFYSTPSMPDSDVISYLIVGRPQNEIDSAQAELIFQAVSQLTHVMGGQRTDVQLNLAEQLKLDQFGFAKKPQFIATPGHNPLEDTVFILGKQLSDRLYLHYSVGVVDTASNLGLRYLLGKNVTIEAQAGTQGSSADVLLSFEGH